MAANKNAQVAGSLNLVTGELKIGSETINPTRKPRTRKNTATAVSGSRKRSASTKRTNPLTADDLIKAGTPVKTSTGTTLALVDGTKAVADKVAEVVKVAETAPQTDFGAKQVAEPAAEVKVAEKPAKAAKKATPAKPAKVAKVAKVKIEVTDADLKRLVYVPDSQGDKAKTRHLDSCPAYFDAKWNNATKFSKVTDAKRLAELTPCRACARRAAAERTAAK